MKPRLSSLAAYRPTLPRVDWSKSWPVIVAFVAIMAIAIALRVPAFDRPTQLKFGTLYQDEYKMYTHTLIEMSGRKDLLSHRPYGIFRILDPQFQIIRVIHGVKYTGKLFPIISMSTFKKTTSYELENTFRLLRLNALVFGLGIIVMTFAIGRKIGGNYGGLLAAFLTSLAPLLVNYSRMMYFDVAMVFFFLVYIYLFARTWETRKLSYLYATVAVSAIAFTMKQNAAVLFVLNPLLAFNIIGDWQIRPTLQSRHTYLLVAMCIALVAFGYPTLFKPGGLSGLFNFASVEIVPNGDSGERVAGSHLWTGFLTPFWVDQAPLAVFFFLATGTAVGAYFALNRNFGWPVLLVGMLYYAIAGYTDHFKDRMLMPLIPLLCLGMAGWAGWVYHWQRRRLGYVLLACTTVLAAVPFLSNTLRYDLLLTLQDTRIEARDWLLAIAPEGSKIAVEAFGPHLPMPLPEQLKAPGNPNFKSFNVKTLGSLASREAQDYVSDNYSYLVEARWNYELALSKDPGADLDEQRRQEGKSVRWGHRREEILRRYDTIAKAFPVAARFTPAPPPGLHRPKNFTDLLFWNWWDPRLITLWKEHNSYVLGSEIVIYKVQ